MPEYALEQPVKRHLLAHNLNDNYLISARSNKYILRIYQAPRSLGSSWRTPKDILYELDLLLHLQRKGVSVAAPLARKDGTLMRILQAPEGSRAAVLFTYAPGSAVTPPRQNRELSGIYGRAIAEIHTSSADFVSSHARFSLDLAYLLDTSLETIKLVLARRPEDLRYLLQMAGLLKGRLIQLIAQGLQPGICHGDAAGGNANISAEKKLTFFDFDVCGPGWRAYDLAVFYWGTLMGKSRLGWNNEQAHELWASYLQGYQQVCEPGERDLQAIPLFAMLRHFWFLGTITANWDYWSYGEIDDDFFDRELTFLREELAPRAD
ncbi:phosphotransferase enzyme family protein [Ktedonosporobacter rubrisoli]|uniref:phosphotransferase enzyme family protein n=1 Tax=Ktedonosporobacter rubrisoli TaxID=2509675 RepID=UPI0013EE433D|nr:phosphotransferase [Ktedonosporobacter rubrisoli]